MACNRVSLAQDKRQHRCSRQQLWSRAARRGLPATPQPLQLGESQTSSIADEYSSDSVFDVQQSIEMTFRPPAYHTVVHRSWASKASSSALFVPDDADQTPVSVPAIDLEHFDRMMAGIEGCKQQVRPGYGTAALASHLELADCQALRTNCFTKTSNTTEGDSKA